MLGRQLHNARGPGRDLSDPEAPNGGDRTGVPSRERTNKQNIIMAAAAAATIIATSTVHLYSVGMYFYYFVIWGAFIYALHRSEIRDFVFAYVINSLFIAVFYIIQTHIYPESYGTTSPLGSWTDDSFFFAIAADSVPPSLELRASYYLYSQPFSTMVQWLTLPSTSHPMDLIFFQSGTAALLATFTKRFMWRMSGDAKLSNVAYLLALTSPFLMMNGGVIFIRDTLVAALLIYSLSCLFDRRFILAGIAILLELVIRPGTGFILLPAIALIYLAGGRLLSPRNLAVVSLCLPLAVLVLARVSIFADLLPQYAASIDQVSVTGREVFNDLRADAGANAIFLALQDQPFLIRFVLNGGYMFAYPFLDPVDAFATPYFDVRTVMMSFLIPIYGFWLNAWFIAGAITRVRAMDRQKLVFWGTILTLLIVGTYSLQTRHKTIIYPLYFLIVAVGMVRARRTDKQIGYAASFALVSLQLAIALR